MPFDSPVQATVAIESDCTKLMRRAWALIDHKDKWVQGAMTRVARRRLEPLRPYTYYLHNRDELFQPVEYRREMAYCSLGALNEAASQGQDGRPVTNAVWCLYTALPPEKRLGAFTGQLVRDSISDFNDTNSWRTVADLWRRALAISARRDMLRSHLV